jgi:outer membrane autotransporter protein
VRDTVGFDFGLDFRGTNDVYLTAEAQSVDKIVEAAVDAAVDDGSVGNGGNIVAVGKTLEAIENQELETLKPLIEALRIEATTPEAAAKALNRLIPQNQPAQTSNTAKSSLTLGNAMFSCAERDGEYAYTREGKCYYARIGARRLDRDATGSGAGVEETAYEVLGGAQVALWDQVRLGFALGYEDLSADTYDQAQALGTSDGDRFNFGLVLKNQWGPVNAYLNLAGSYTGYDHTRFVGLGSGMDRATGEQDVWSQTTRVRFSYLNDLGPWYWKPMIDLAATYVGMEGYTERGAGAANLRVASSDEWLLSVMPGMEVGGEVRSADGMIWRPYARAGVIVFDDNETSVTANFASAPAGLIPFEVSGEFDQVQADVEAGVIVLTTSGINMKLNYEGRYGENSQQHGGGLKITAPY